MPRSSPRDVLLAIDPGREKCGVAVVDASGGLVHKAVIPTPEVVATARRLIGRHGVRSMIVGTGTGSDDIRRALQEALPELAPEGVPEHRSTERALERWRDVEQPRGWRRLLPRSLRFPTEPIDDYAAWVLADDYLADRGL